MFALKQTRREVDYDDVGTSQAHAMGNVIPWLSKHKETRRLALLIHLGIAIQLHYAYNS